MQKGFDMGELEDKYGHYTIKGCVEKESKNKEDGKDELAYVWKKAFTWKAKKLSNLSNNIF